MVQDLVSILLRKETDLPLPPANPMLASPQKEKIKKGAEKSMTEYVLDNTPLKSIGFKEASPAVEPQGKLETRREDEEIICQGHRMKSLNKSADNLLKAAIRLNREVEKETRYWEQVLSVRDSGWAMIGLPRDRQNLAVRFGFSEADSAFARRGFATLRGGESGDIILDEALTSATKSIRVRIFDHGKVVGSSRLLHVDNESDVSVGDLIRRARDTLFDEELFQELTRESRLLVADNVTMNEDTICIPYGQFNADEQISLTSEREVVIDLIGKDNTSTMDERVDDMEAQGIALALRILLSYTHRQHLQRRSRIPPPLTDRKRDEAPPPILRVLIGYLQQKTGLDAICSHLDTLVVLFQTAGLVFSYSIHNASPELSEWFQKNKGLLTNSSNSGSHTSFEDLVGTLCAPFETIITLSMVRSTGSLERELGTISLRTHMLHPLFGTRLELRVLDGDLKPANTPDTETYESLNGLILASNRIISSHLAHHIASKHNSWRTVPGGNEAFKRASSTYGKSQRIGLLIAKGSLGITWQGVEGKGDGRHLWSIGQDQEDANTFDDVLDGITLTK